MGIHHYNMVTRRGMVYYPFFGSIIDSGRDIKLNRNEGIKKNLGTINLMPKAIEVSKIDVEGEELNVLKSIDLVHYKPQLISIEIHNKENMYDDSYEYYKKDEIYIYLQKLDYNLIWKNEILWKLIVYLQVYQFFYLLFF